jgi:cytoskeletal protein CcmA (bactofilin family)
MNALQTSFDGEGEERLRIHCLHCRRPLHVSPRALTLTCKYCNKALKVEAVTIGEYQARRVIETCGCLTVEKTGNVFSDRILCGSLVARGRIKGNILSFGPVLVAPEAQIKGDITAPSLSVGEGARLEGRYAIGGDESHLGI